MDNLPFDFSGRKVVVSALTRLVDLKAREAR